MYDDLQSGLLHLQEGYRKDYWKDQPNYCELWCEKDTVIGSVWPTINELGIQVRVGRGYDSTSGARNIAEDFNHIAKPVHVFYLGDHDASGRQIEDSLAKRVREYGGPPFEITRVAIHKADIKKFKLPPQRVKDSDPRANWFKRKFGGQCVELDALPVEELRRRIRVAVEELIDCPAWQRALRVEKAELESIDSIITRMQMGF